jgi:phosphoglycerate-specific signal transduction histidine kinase
VPGARPQALSSAVAPAATEGGAGDVVHLDALNIDRIERAHFSAATRLEAPCEHRRHRRQVLERARELTDIKETSALVREALTALIQREAARRLALLGGTMPDAQHIPRRRPAPEEPDAE